MIESRNRQTKAWPTGRAFCVLGEPMARRGKKFFESYSKRGEWAELLFMTVAAGRGFNVAKPWGESPRYDVAVEQGARFLRVQVKSTDTTLQNHSLCQSYSHAHPP